MSCLTRHSQITHPGNENRVGRQKTSDNRGPVINRHLDNRVNVFEVAPIFPKDIFMNNRYKMYAGSVNNLFPNCHPRSEQSLFTRCSIKQLPRTEDHITMWLDVGQHTTIHHFLFKNTKATSENIILTRLKYYFLCWAP